MSASASVANTRPAARSVTASINYLASECSAPQVNNGDFSKNIFPLEGRTNIILDGETFDTPPSLDVEGFARVKHEYDVTGLADSDEAKARYLESLAHLIKELTGADEVNMLPVCMVREQTSSAIAKDIEKGVPATFVHADSTEAGAPQAERYFYPAPSGDNVRRTVQVNLWKLLSSTPTPFPLALCDARSVKPGDIVPGPAYFPSIDDSIDTAFFHPSDHLRWVYFSKLSNQELLVFKQYDSDKSAPERVPHTAFEDPSCPADADPRVSIECRCLLRWYD